MRSIYLDHNATTPMAPAAADAMNAALRECGNASSVHWAGRRARARIDGARDAVAALVGAAPADVVFTSVGTEANNLSL
ncbi:MAG: aminotransferase class V-fold PLP-dependent enzyme, partial [Rhodospirillaceae bacterium]|nr:aminotransferase class V-fold PLP-dependent enzyme [Rhodospirillaceae bacterium]